MQNCRVKRPGTRAALIGELWTVDSGHMRRPEQLGYKCAPRVTISFLRCCDLDIARRQRASDRSHFALYAIRADTLLRNATEPENFKRHLFIFVSFH